MTTDRFEISLKRVLGVEGGLVDHVKDRGGRTNFGITEGTLRDAVSQGLVTTQRVDDLTADDVRIIYKKNYWNAVSADGLPVPIDFATFDAAVNHGPGRAAEFLQRAVGSNVDRKIGPNTLSAVGSMSVEDVLERFNARRIEFYMKLDPDQIATFGKGWANRVAHVIAECYGDLR